MDDLKTNSLKPTRPLRYAVGMFGTSIPVNMFKTYAAFSMWTSWDSSRLVTPFILERIAAKRCKVCSALFGTE